jgi:chaperonin cofactor prefoldin
MNAKLLKKIEELTLHLIDMKKGMEKQEKEIQDLKSKIK